MRELSNPYNFLNGATPIVPVVKSDGSVRVCGDYKLTVNKFSKLGAYPIPKLRDDLYTKLAGSITINTHKGLYRYNHLPYRVSYAPSIFQRTMEGLLHGIPHVGVLLDNILITGTTDGEPLDKIKAVLKCLFDPSLRLKRHKCQFMKSLLECLGHLIADKVEIAQAHQKFQHHQHSKSRSFEVRDAVQVCNYSGKQKWSYRTVVEHTGPVSVKVKLQDGTVVRRHHDQLLKNKKPPVPASHGVLDEPEFQSRDVNQLAIPIVDLPRQYPIRNCGQPEHYTYL